MQLALYRCGCPDRDRRCLPVPARAAGPVLAVLFGQASVAGRGKVSRERSAPAG